MVRNFLKPGQPAYAAELDPANAAFDAEKYRIEVLNRFGARFENRFNEFQSVSQGDADNPRGKAGPTLQANLGTASVNSSSMPSRNPTSLMSLNVQAA